MTAPHPARPAGAAAARPPTAAPTTATPRHPDSGLRALQGPSLPQTGALAPGSTPTPPATPHPAPRLDATPGSTPPPPATPYTLPHPDATPDLAARPNTAPAPSPRLDAAPDLPPTPSTAPGSPPDAAAPAHPPPGDADPDPTPDDAPFGFATPNRHGPLTGALLALIGGYKRFLSPALPPSCRFVPTCSEYGYEAVARYGIIRGGRMALWRILRCNPFGRGGVDPVP